MFNFWNNAFSWESAVKRFSTFVVKTSYVFIRLMPPIFFFEAVCTSPMFAMLNMNNNNKKLREVIKRLLSCRNIPIFMQKFLLQNVGLNFLADWVITWNLALINVNVGFQIWSSNDSSSSEMAIKNTVQTVLRNPQTCTSNKVLVYVLG